MAATKRNTAKKVKHALEKAHAAKERATKLEQEARNMAVDQELKNDREYKRLQNEIANIRKDLHRTRLNLSKKAYSIEVREKQLADTREAYEAYQEKEKKSLEAMQQLEEELERLREDTAKRIDI